MSFEIILKNGQTWLICGGRRFWDREMFNSAMGDLIRLRGVPDTVIQGGADGADTLAAEWAKSKALWLTTFKANWGKYGNGAGPIRNQQMLDEGKPDFVVAFPGGNGTEDMKARARKAGIDVAEIVPTSTKGGE